MNSKNPILFGLAISKKYKKWAILALVSVFFASSFSQINVLILGRLTDVIAAKDIVIDDVWFWAIAYPVMFALSQIMWRCSGFSGMRWFANYHFTAYQSLYDYLTLHSRDYFNN